MGNFSKKLNEIQKSVQETRESQAFARGQLKQILTEVKAQSKICEKTRLGKDGVIRRLERVEGKSKLSLGLLSGTFIAAIAAFVKAWFLSKVGRGE